MLRLTSRLGAMRNRLPWVTLFLGGGAAFFGYVSLMTVIAPNFLHWMSYEPQVHVFATTVTMDWTRDQIAMVLLSTPLLLLYAKREVLAKRSMSLPSLIVASLFLAWLPLLLVRSSVSAVLLLALGVASAIVATKDADFILGMNPPTARRTWLWGFMATWLTVGVLALGRWVLHSFEPSSMYGGMDWHFPVLELEVFHSLQLFAAPLVLVVLYLWAPSLLYSKVRIRDVDSLVSDARRFLKSRKMVPTLSLEGAGRSVLSHPRAVLVGAVILSVFVGWFPYAIAPDAGPWEGFVGVDTQYYYEDLVRLASMDPTEAFSAAFRYAPSRPLFFHQLLVLSGLGLSPKLVVALEPAVLAVALALSTYFFVWASFRREDYAALASLLVPLSPVFTVGMFGGLFANWLALAVLLVVYGVFLLSLRRKPRRVFLPLALLLSPLLLFIHPWTWAAMMVTLGVFAAYYIGRDVLQRKLPRSPPVLYAGALILTNLVADTLKGLDWGGGSSGLSGSGAAAFTASSTSFGGREVGNLLSNLYTATYVDFAGFYANVFFLVLVVVGLLALLRLRGPPSVLLLVWVAAVGLGFPLFDFKMQVRLLFDLPWVPIAALGLFKTASWVGGRSHRLSSTFLLLAAVVGLNYSLRAVSNLLAPL